MSLRPPLSASTSRPDDGRNEPTLSPNAAPVIEPLFERPWRGIW